MSFEPDPIRLRPPRGWNSLTFLILTGSALLGLLLARRLAQTGWAGDLWQAFAMGSAAALLAAAVGLGVYAALRPRASREIEFGETSVRLPAGHYSPRRLDVDYARIFGLERMGRTRWPRVVIGVRGRLPITYLERALERPDDAQRLLAELRLRIAAQPGGDAQLRALDARHRIQERAFRGAFPVTLAALLLLVAVFALEVASGALRNVAELVRLGGQVPLLVLDGEWWRLASACLLHMDPPHLYMNGIGLLTLGFLLERLLGALRFSWLLLTGALGSGLVSVALGGHTVSVGASGAIFALVGGWLVLNTWHRDSLPPALCLPAWYIAGVAVLEIGSEALIPNIDTAAHVGGLATGVVAMLLALPHRSLERSLSRTPRPLVLGTALLAVAFAGSAATAAWSVIFGGEAYATRFVAALLDVERPETPEADVAINELAWLLATSAQPPPAGFAPSIARMQKVVRRNPDEPHYLDTLATLHYRAGEAGTAVALQRRALAVAPVESAHLYAAQLARFHAQQLASGDVLGADAWEGPLPVVERVAAREGEPGPLVLEVGLGGPLRHGAKLEALVWDGETLHSLLVIELAPQEREVVRLTATDDTFARMPEDARIQLALVEAEWPLAPDGTPLASGHWSWRAYPYLEGVAQLP